MSCMEYWSTNDKSRLSLLDQSHIEVELSLREQGVGEVTGDEREFWSRLLGSKTEKGIRHALWV